MSNDPIDVVYTWVDDSFPGYLDLLNAHSSDKRDLNPNRTRDNLDVIRYSMRSVAQYLPNVRRIYLLTCRPQVPSWLDVDHPKIQVVHHDQVMGPDIIPTFSSFGIVSHLHLLPDLSESFIYLEDDILLNAPDVMGGLQGGDGRPIVNLSERRIVPLDKLNSATSSPWNLALANADAILSARFSDGPRRHVAHAPQLLNRIAMTQAVAEFPEVFEATRRNKFRCGDAIPPEVFVPHYMIETDMATKASRTMARRMEGYVSIENFAPWTWAQLKRIDFRKPLSIALNDSFGARPNPRVVQMVRSWLSGKFPTPAAWERM